MAAQGVNVEGKQRPDPGSGLKLSRQGLMEEALSGFGAVAWASPGRILSREVSNHKALFEQL